MSEIENKIEEVKKGCGKNNYILNYSDGDKEDIKCKEFDLCPPCQAKLEELNFANNVLKEDLKKKDKDIEELIILGRRQAEEIIKLWKELKKAQEDLKKKVEELKYYQRRMLKERITDLFGFVEKHYMDDFLYEVVDREIDKIFKDVLEKQGERE